MARQERYYRHRNRIFPIGGVILLLVGIVWLLNDFNVFVFPISWVPLVVIVIGIGVIINHVYKRKNK